MDCHYLTLLVSVRTNQSKNRHRDTEVSIPTRKEGSYSSRGDLTPRILDEVPFSNLSPEGSKILHGVPSSRSPSPFTGKTKTTEESRVPRYKPYHVGFEVVYSQY